MCLKLQSDQASQGELSCQKHLDLTSHGDGGATRFRMHEETNMNTFKGKILRLKKEEFNISYKVVHVRGADFRF